MWYTISYPQLLSERMTKLLIGYVINNSVSEVIQNNDVSIHRHLYNYGSCLNLYAVRNTPVLEYLI